MATGLAIVVTVLGVAAILALFGILARQLGLWAWALNWIRATKEEKTKLCRQERDVSSRSYMDQNNGFEDHYRKEHRLFYKLDNDLDWINLWPRSGSYKRFSNLDEVGPDDSQLRMGSTMIPDPSIPPQPLRPAPGPPHRMCGKEDGILTNPFSFAGAGMMMEMMMRDHRMMPQRGSDMGRPIPMMDSRRDSNRSMSARIRSSPCQDYGSEMGKPLMEHNTSTNPFRSGAPIDYSMYSHHYPNPFAATYSYPSRSQPYHAIDEDNCVVGSRRTYASNVGRSDQLYSPKSYDEYPRISPLHTQSIDMGRERIMSHSREEDFTPKYRYTPEISSSSSSQVAYNHSLNQALMKKRALQQASIQQQRYINRIDKIKQDEERIREEERILNQLRYENDLMRRERFEDSLKGNSPFSLTSLNSNLYDITGTTRELDRETISDNLAYDYQRGASGLREELQKRMIYDMRTFSLDSRDSRDSPPPPAPDMGPNMGYSESPDVSPKEKMFDWRDRLGRNAVDFPATPPNTAALTPPNPASPAATEQRRSSLVDPYTNSLLKERLAEIEALRIKESELKMLNEKIQEQKTNLEDNQTLAHSKNTDDEPINNFYHNVFYEDRDDIGGELTKKLHALQEGKGPDIYPKALKERIEKRREREGSRRKRKRERELERRGSLRQMKETMKSFERNETDTMPHVSNPEIESYAPQVDNTTNIIIKSPTRETLNSEQRLESAFINVPISVDREQMEGEMTDRTQTKEVDNVIVSEESSHMLSITNAANKNLGGSPIVPRKSFLSYKGSWTLGSNGNDENQIIENEDDPDRKRVREYIASLSARLQQLPDNNEGQMQNIPQRSPIADAPSQDHFFTSTIMFPTPPSSAARTNSQSSSDTPSSTAANWGSVHSWRGSTETPPHSATRTNSQSSSDTPSSTTGNWGLPHSWRISTDNPSDGMIEESPKPMCSETPPTSVGCYPPTPPNSASSNFSETPPPSAGYSATPPNSSGLNGSFDLGTTGVGGNTGGGSVTPMLKRAVSCDSVSSDTSVTLGELDDESGQITGYLSVQVVYECDTQDLEVLVLEARDIVAGDPNLSLDTYVRVFLLPDKSTNMQTRVAKRTNNPSYRERFLFALEEDEALDRSLSFYMYSTDKFTNTMIGEAHMKLADLDLSSSSTIEMALTDSGQKGIGYGEIMFSLSYLPTAERLTVVVVKAKGLVYGDNRASADPFIKVYILQNGKKIMKKKTSVKKGTDSPVFNEAMIFNVPAPSLHNIQLRVTVAEYTGDHSLPIAVGHVIVGTQATGKALSHWNQMMSSLRKPIAMWHALRR